jgi:peptide/nickel transport system substrate-binding protein
VRSDEFEQAKWVSDLVALNWDMVLVNNSVITGDADYTLRRLYHSTANRTGYANPQLDSLLDGAAASVDQKKRQDLYSQADKIIWDDAVGIFPFEYLETYVYHKNLQCLVVTPNETPEFNRVTVG